MNALDDYLSKVISYGIQHSRPLKKAFGPIEKRSDKRKGGQQRERESESQGKSRENVGKYFPFHKTPVTSAEKTEMKKTNVKKVQRHSGTAQKNQTAAKAASWDT
ncbi:hypothetical protein RUM43_008727 [Polyplax serrata]|uniref:Uncharacterized protein n=1 Tax=Polyplax serrata TaxID=468196 RepID=A0AAN8S0Q1_POLSC